MPTSLRPAPPLIWHRVLPAFLALLLLSGCLKDSIDNSLTPLVPPLTLRWPVTGDTLFTGPHQVLYDLSGVKGVDHYQLFVNDTLYNSYPDSGNGKAPVVLWTVDSTLLGRRVRYFLRAYDIDGDSVTSSTMTNIYVTVSPTRPLPPLNLALWPIDASTINLTWENQSANETGFELWRKAGAADWAVVQTMPARSTSTNDTGLVEGVAYHYKVRAVNAFGYGESNEVSIGTDLPVMDPPTNLQATPLGTRLIELDWNDNSVGELGFVIQRRITTGSVWAQIAMTEPNVTTYFDTTGLVGSGSYTYRVAARGQFAQSAWSNEAGATTLYLDTYPPTNLAAAFDVPSKTVKLTWKSNTIYDAQTRVERRIDPTGPFVEIAKLGPTSTAYADSAILAGYPYAYRVRVLSVDGHFTLYSNTASVQVPKFTAVGGERRRMPARRRSVRTADRHAPPPGPPARRFGERIRADALRAHEPAGFPAA